MQSANGPGCPNYVRALAIAPSSYSACPALPSSPFLTSLATSIPRGRSTLYTSRASHTSWCHEGPDILRSFSHQELFWSMRKQERKDVDALLFPPYDQC